MVASAPQHTAGNGPILMGMATRLRWTPPLCLALLIASGLPAQTLHENADDPRPVARPASPAGADDEVDHGHFRNEFMLFVGETRKGGVGEVTVGFDYMRTLGEHWGAAVFLDYAHGAFEREYIAGVGLFWAPLPFAPDFHLLVGAGWEGLDENVPHHHAHEHHEPHVDADFAADWHHEDLLLGRIGGSYLLHVGIEGQFVLAPQLFYDVVQGRGRDALVFGVGFGYLF
jgi:hypothetical protein